MKTNNMGWCLKDPNGLLVWSFCGWTHRIVKEAWTDRQEPPEDTWQHWYKLGWRIVRAGEVEPRSELDRQLVAALGELGCRNFGEIVELARTRSGRQTERSS